MPTLSQTFTGTVADLEEEFRNASTPPERKEELRVVAAETFGLKLGQPPSRSLGAVWIILVGALAVAALGFGVLTYLLINAGKAADTSPLVGLASLALGALVGLITPSPAQQPSSIS